MTDPEADLDAYLAGEFEVPNDPEERTRFRVDNDRKAAWAQHQLGLCRAEVKRITDAAADRIERVKTWKDEALAGPLADVAFFEALLVEYVRPMLEEQLRPHLDAGLSLAEAWDKVKRKGYALPDGRVQGRKAGGGPSIEDEAAYVAWCIANERYDLIRSEPAKAALNDVAVVKDGAVYTDEGVRVEGVTVTPVEIRITA